MRKLLLIAVALVFAMPSAHADGLFTTETDYFHCNPAQSTPVGNADLALGDASATWDTAMPTKSLTLPGADACGFVATGATGGLAYENIYEMCAHGPFLGDLDSLTITFYAFWAAPSAAGLLPDTVRFHVGVDGISMFGDTTDASGTSAGPDTGQTQVVPTATSTPGLYRFDVSVIGMNFIGDDSAEHEVQITAFVRDIATTDPRTVAVGAGWYPIDTVESITTVAGLRNVTPSAINFVTTRR